MQQPIWLLSLDSDTFPAAPMTTGGLKAYYQVHGKQPNQTDIQLVHFVNEPERIEAWLTDWKEQQLAIANKALEEGLQPIMGFSVYTWNAAEFLDVMRAIKALCPRILIVAGGPHVQKAADYLFSEALDLVVMGEGEETLTELIDTPCRSQWPDIAGLAYVNDGELKLTAARPRQTDLDSLPSALDAISLYDGNGEPYECISYETSRGCPYKCAFCEWGTGAIGTKMLSVSPARVKRDWNRIVDAGIKNIWLADSNFGALREDVEKADILCEIKKRTGLPTSFATSWSKKHGSRSRQIVLQLHANDLLPHYHLALQTLTPLALELSHRKNMDANKYEPIARDMARAGIPIACELIWGLVGDNLEDFEKHLDALFAIFPTIHIFGYTLLPGTEFYDRREEYEIETLPVAGYGKAKGEYVVGCMSFPVEEGLEGYFLLTAHQIMSRGYVMPMTLRYLALSKATPVAGLMRAVLRALCEKFNCDVPGLVATDIMDVYERRSELFVAVIKHPDRTYECLEQVAQDWADTHISNATDAASLKHRLQRLLALDKAFAPRCGPTRQDTVQFDFDADAVLDTLENMELPTPEMFAAKTTMLHLTIPGGVGELINDPDGGVWIHAERADPPDDTPDTAQPVEIASLAAGA